MELHNKTFLSFLGLFISTGGWFVWNIFLAAVYPNKQTIYFVHRAFLSNFGKNPTWWTTVILTLCTVIILELIVGAVRRVYWPNDQDIMQRIERDKSARSVLKEHAAETGDAPGAGAAGRGHSFSLNALQDGRFPQSRDGELSPVTAGSSSDFGSVSYQMDTLSARRPRPSHDDYVPPYFTPPAEEREDPFNLDERTNQAVNYEAKDKRGQAVVSPSPLGRVMGQERAMVESPLSMESLTPAWSPRLPPSRGRSIGGADKARPVSGP